MPRKPLTLAVGSPLVQIGCGTAVPTCAVFARLLNEIAQSPTPEDGPRPQKTRVHVQDYNKQGERALAGRGEVRAFLKLSH